MGDGECDLLCTVGGESPDGELLGEYGDEFGCDGGVWFFGLLHIGMYCPSMMVWQMNLMLSTEMIVMRKLSNQCV